MSVIPLLGHRHSSTGWPLTRKLNTALCHLLCYPRTGWTGRGVNDPSVPRGEESAGLCHPQALSSIPTDPPHPRGPSFWPFRWGSRGPTPCRMAVTDLGLALGASSPLHVQHWAPGCPGGACGREKPPMAHGVRTSRSRRTRTTGEGIINVEL